MAKRVGKQPHHVDSMPQGLVPDRDATILDDPITEPTGMPEVLRIEAYIQLAPCTAII